MAMKACHSKVLKVDRASEGFPFPSRGFFSTTFGKDWQKKEKAFWEEVSSGKYEQKPVILKK